jgi:hypothetical protein
MPRIALWNLFFGFTLICFAAAAGALVANDLTNSFVDAMEATRPAARDWMMTLQASAHGHSNLFGMLHIATGLTMPYARQNHTTRSLVTAGLTLGSIAMGPLMIWRSMIPPARDIDANGILIGICLSFALGALATHAAGLWQAFARRN